MKSLHRQGRTRGVASAIDPRIRLMAALLLLGLIVSSRTVQFPLLVTFLALGAALLSGMPFRMILLRLTHPLILAVMVIILKAVTGSTPLLYTWQTGSLLLSVSAGGLLEGLLLASRITGAVSVIILLSRGLTFTESMAALAWLRIPRPLVEVSLFAWRSLFTLYDDAGTVFTAQKNRMGYSGIRRGLRSFGTMAGMLTIRAFDSSRSITTAMSQRGYDGTLPLLATTPLQSRQLAGLVLFAAAAAVVWSFPA